MYNNSLFSFTTNLCEAMLYLWLALSFNYIQNMCFLCDTIMWRMSWDWLIIAWLNQKWNQEICVSLREITFTLLFCFFFASASYECNGQSVITCSRAVSEIIYYQSNDLAEINRAFPGGDWETKTLLVEFLNLETTTHCFRNFPRELLHVPCSYKELFQP